MLIEPHVLDRVEAIAIGASAGAVAALERILPYLPAVTRVPVIVVVHLPQNSKSALPTLFATKCAAPVREPLDKEPASAGTIWFAPADYHLLIETTRTFALSTEPAVNHSRPSIDVLLHSAAIAYGDALCTVMLTGANEDGSAGARDVRNAGGLVVVQDPATADSAAMPRATLALAEPHFVGSLEEIRELLVRIAQVKS